MYSKEKEQTQTKPMMPYLFIGGIGLVSLLWDCFRQGDTQELGEIGPWQWFNIICLIGVIYLAWKHSTFVYRTATIILFLLLIAWEVVSLTIAAPDIVNQWDLFLDASWISVAALLYFGEDPRRNESYW